MFFFKPKDVAQSDGTYRLCGRAQPGWMGQDCTALFRAPQQFLALRAASKLVGAWVDSLARIFVSAAFKKKRTPSQLLQQLKSPVLCPVESTLKLQPSLIQVLA